MAHAHGPPPAEAGFPPDRFHECNSWKWSLPQGRYLGYKKIIRRMKNFSHSLSMKPTQHFVVSFGSRCTQIFKVLGGLSLSR
jgi:hypothetical protein